MNPKGIIASGITGTSAMSAFSYAASEVDYANFREPEVLGKLLQRLVPDMNRTVANVAGWNMHYAVGFAFTTAYDQIWKKTPVRPSVASGAVLGAISGLIGIAVWKLTFNMHPNPPVKNLPKYFRHLLVAHIIFGIAAAEGYKRSKKV